MADDQRAAENVTEQASMAPACKSFGCDESATHETRGLPGYEWGGYYCQHHAEGHRGHYDGQGGFRIRRITERTWTYDR